jgi:hypothetical protein
MRLKKTGMSNFWPSIFTDFGEAGSRKKPEEKTLMKLAL